MTKLLFLLKLKLRIFKVFFRKKIFRLIESYLKLHITPVHFYSPIPNVGELKTDIYTQVNDCPGVEFNDNEQQSFLKTVVPAFMDEYFPLSQSGLSKVDAFLLYTIIRTKKPRLFIEIGSGESTKISLKAIEENEKEGVQCRFIAIEPYPIKYLKDIKNPNFQLIEKKVQDVDLSTFVNADILFIDSSHVSKIGSDVNYEILNIIPSLKLDALIHWHDIMFPSDYPRSWIDSGRMFWNESYMVHAFILNNECFKVKWASKYMQINHPDLLHRTFKYFSPTDPDEQLSSFWIKRVK